MTSTSKLKTELIKKTSLLGKELALLPYQDRALDEIIFELERNNPNELPFQADSLHFCFSQRKFQLERSDRTLNCSRNLGGQNEKIA